MWLFFDLEKCIFLGLFWLDFGKTCNILRKSKINLIYFGKFSLQIWPFFLGGGGPGNPVLCRLFSGEDKIFLGEGKYTVYTRV
jgi:hypothetical protein